MNKWDQRFMRIAHEVQSWSKDPNRQVGAVVVSPDRRSISTGYNGLPVKLDDAMLDVIDRETKNRLMIHAERNAIDNCPAKVHGWTMYVTRFPCSHCAGAMIQNGIVRLVTQELDKTSNWLEDMELALVMLESAGIDVVQIRETPDEV